MGAIKGMLLGLMALAAVGCSGPKALYVQGGKDASAHFEGNAVTGGFTLHITGPFILCKERIYSKEALDLPESDICKPQPFQANPRTPPAN